MSLYIRIADFTECQRKLLADEQTLQSDTPTLTSAITSDSAGELTEDFGTILNSTIPGVVMGSAGSSSVPRRSMIFQAQPWYAQYFVMFYQFTIDFQFH